MRARVYELLILFQSDKDQAPWGGEAGVTGTLAWAWALGHAGEGRRFQSQIAGGVG